jgi:hypothetical protein
MGAFESAASGTVREKPLNMGAVSRDVGADSIAFVQSCS